MRFLAIRNGIFLFFFSMVIIAFVPLMSYLGHLYSRWNANMEMATYAQTEQSSLKQMEIEGKKALAHAEWDKKIQIADAIAKREAAISLAQVEIERARGMAEANRIIGDSLKGNEGYLRYLWIQGLQSNNNSTIYIPTEAGLPILESTRFMKEHAEK